MKKDTVIVTDFDGKVEHRFCTAEEGNAILDATKARRSAGSLFTTEREEMDAETLYAVSPNLRERVERAKAKLTFDLQVRDTLDKHGVPDEPALRKSVYGAIKELTGFSS